MSVTAAASDAGTLTYQWYSNTTPSTTNATPITGETARTYTPPTTTVGTTYYYVVVTNTNNSVNGTKTAEATSAIAYITVKAVVTGISDVTFTTSPAVVAIDGVITLGGGALTPAGAIDESEYAVEWRSSDAEVAAVGASNKIVTGVSAGTATIYAEAKKSGAVVFAKTLAVTVPALPVTSVAVGPAATTGITSSGGTLQLTVTVEPAKASNKTVTWSSSNANIATVNPATGVVTAVNNGEVVITATSVSNPAVTGAKELAISGQPIRVSSIQVSGANNATGITARDGTLQLTAAVAPENATNKNVTWASGNEEIATVSSSGLVTGKGNGTVTITAAAAEANSTVRGAISLTLTNQIGTTGLIRRTCPTPWLRALMR